jgi:hypothetical protein
MHILIFFALKLNETTKRFSKNWKFWMVFFGVGVRHAALHDAVSDRPLLPVDFQAFAKRMAEKVGYCRHWWIRSLHTPESFSSTLVWGLFPLYRE